MSELINMGTLQLGFLHSKDGTGSLDMFEMTLHPNARMPVGHYHESRDEIVYGLTGTTTWSIDGKDINVAPGESRLHQARHHPRFHKSHRPGGDVSLYSHSRYVGPVSLQWSIIAVGSNILAIGPKIASGRSLLVLY